MTQAQYDQQFPANKTVAKKADLTIPVWVYLSGMLLIYGLSGVNIVMEWDRRAVFRLGRFVGTVGPGCVWVDPCLSRTRGDWSLREYVDQIQIANIQTHDNVPIEFTMLLTRCVSDPSKAETVVSKAWTACTARAAAVATELVGSTELDDILHNRTKLYVAIVRELQERVAAWGLQIKAVEFQDIKITDESIQEAISMKARASKEAQAELVRAEMQIQIADHLNRAAAAYSDSGKWLKGMETMLELCRSAENNTVLLPTQLLGIFGGSK